MTIAANTKLGPYEILSPIGAGGMGEVYRAKDTRLDRIVAIKVLPLILSSNPDFRQRFEREARAVSALNHPHICVLHDIGRQDDVDFIVMEFLEGETLRSRLESGKLPTRKAIDLAIQIANGLGAAHERGIVHRDLKPENIFVTTDDRIKILDFGLAHQTEPLSKAEVSSVPTRARMTDPGTILGTVGYMSPEQIRGQEVDARSDIFSLGVILYEMLCGQRAFQRDTPPETMSAILKEEPAGIETIAENVPPALSRIIQRCLEKRPELRFRTTQDLAFALEMSGTTSSSGSIRTETPVAAKRKWSYAALLSTVLVAMALGAGLWIGRQMMQPRPVSFKQLTFKRGYIQSAAFAPDGTTIIYGASLAGPPVQLYSTRTDSIESRSLELPPADVLNISRTGDMAILLNRRFLGTWVSVGTLAKVGVGGGAPKEILADVNDGDITADGQNFAVVHEVGTIQRLEYPIGKVLFETTGYITSPRISPDGKRIAFAEHPIYGDDRGYVSVAENGTIARITSEFTSVTGIVWAQSGEIWFSGSIENEDGELWSVQPGNKPRALLKAPVELRIHSISPKGQIVLSSGERRAELAGLLAGDTKERDLSWYGDEDVAGISADATLIAASQTIQGSGSNYQIYFRRADGSGTVQLGEGNGEAVSADGKWILASLPAERQNKLILYPTGPGEKKLVELGDIDFSASKGARLVQWSNDGRRIAFLGHRSNQPLLAYVMDLQAVSRTQSQNLKRFPKFFRRTATFCSPTPSTVPP